MIGVEQVIRNNLNQRWPCSLTLICVTRPQRVIQCVPQDMYSFLLCFVVIILPVIGISMWFIYLNYIYVMIVLLLLYMSQLYGRIHVIDSPVFLKAALLALGQSYFVIVKQPSANHNTTGQNGNHLHDSLGYTVCVLWRHTYSWFQTKTALLFALVTSTLQLHFPRVTYLPLV